MNKLNLIQVHPKDLSKNPWNSNFVDPENQQKLDSSLDRLGFFKPVLIRELDDGSFQIIGGEHRWISAMRRDETIPAINLGKISDEKAKEISVVDNARYGIDDQAALEEILSSAGMDAEELNAILPTGCEFDGFFDRDHEFTDDFDFDTNDDYDDNHHDSSEVSSGEMRAGSDTITMQFRVSKADAQLIDSKIRAVVDKFGYEENNWPETAGKALSYLIKK